MIQNVHGGEIVKNYEIIQGVVEYIENHLYDSLYLDDISMANGYSKYHLSRMFSSCTDFSVHEYVRRRRLTEAARKLVETNERIIDIALESGYDNQQSFTIAFSKMYGYTPAEYRANKMFHPIQLFLRISSTRYLKGDCIMDIRMEREKPFHLVGVKANTAEGFHVIGMCWGQLHRRKTEIENRTDTDFLIGLNDYSAYDETSEGQQAFDYFACAEVCSFEQIPEHMVTKQLPISDYVVFTYKGKSQDSMEPVVNYIYKEWFPESTCRLNEEAKYDFVRYGETVDEEGESIIEYWVPIV